MNQIRYIVVIILVALTTNICVSASEIKTIAFAQDTMANDFRKAQVLEVKYETQKHPELKFIYSDANGQTSLLISQIKQFINMKVDLIIVGTNNEEAVVPVISEAISKGVKVIVLDRGIKGNNYTTFINSDNKKIGAIAASYLAKKLKQKGTILIFEGLLAADVTKLRTKGFMQEISKYKDIKIIKRTGNYLRRDAIFETEKLINESIHFDAIFSHSDSMLSGVRSALYRYHIDPSSIITIGCDYTSEAKRAIEKGVQTASILFPLGAKESVDVALKILSKKKVAKHIELPVKLITTENTKNTRAIF